MKRYLHILFAVALILALAALPAFAEVSPRLIDGADLVSEADGASISQKLDEISEKYNYDVAVVTVDSIEETDPDAAAELTFDTIGYGKNNNGGVLLLIAMESRDVVVFYDSVLNVDIAESIRETVTPYLSDGNYAEAFNVFADECDYYVNGEMNGYPFAFGTTLFICVAIGFIVAFIATSIMKGQLKSVAFRREATNYVTEGSLAVTVSNDTYLYSTVTRTEKPKDNGSSSSSGSSGSRGSSSGKF